MALAAVSPAVPLPAVAPMLVVRRGKAPVIVAELPEERAPAKVASEPPALKMVHHPARETAATKEAAMGDQPAPLAPALKVGAMEQAAMVEKAILACHLIA